MFSSMTTCAALQHALVLAFGIDDALAAGARGGEDRLHDEAGAEDEAV